MTVDNRPRADKRDFLGYAGAPPDPRWPGGARVALSFVVNFEEGAEFSVSEGDAVNEAIYEVDHRLEGPDPCIESHFDYGARAGWWRIMDLFDAYGVKVTVSACGRAVERSPALATTAGYHWCFMHVTFAGWRWWS